MPWVDFNCCVCGRAVRRGWKQAAILDPNCQVCTLCRAVHPDTCVVCDKELGNDRVQVVPKLLIEAHATCWVRRKMS